MANETNIPNEINLPGSLTGRHESSFISPMGFSAFTTNMKSDIAPMSTLSFTTNFKSDVSPIPFANFATAMKSDIAPVTLRPPEMKSLYEIQINPLSGRHESSDTTPVNSILGVNNESSTTSPITSTLTGRFDSSAITPLISKLSGRFESSGIDSSVTTLGGRHESSGIDSSATTLGGRHEASGIDSSATTLGGRHESSGIDDGATTLDGRHESSAVNDSWNQDIIFPIQQADLSPYAQPGTANWMDDTFASGFTLNKEPQQTDYTPAGLEYSPYPGAPGPIALAGRNESSNFSKEPGVNFVDIPNGNATGFTVQNSILDSQFKGIAGQNYTYPNAQGLGFGSVDSSQGVNFLDIPNQDSQGFTTFFDTGTPTQFKGATAGEYTYPDSHGLGYGLIGNSLFTNMYPTPYTTPLFPDGFTQNQSVEDSQFSKDSFSGGGKIGLETEFTHATFGGVQAQVPIMGNNPTGLGEFSSGGNTSGDIGIINAFDDTTSGAKGFTPQMFDLALPKTQFNGVAGTPGSLEYTYPTEVGPAGTGRLMYDTPFSDAGNPYGGQYSSELAKQIPINPSITINKDTGVDQVNYSLYDADPDRLHFHQGNKYQESLGNFSTTITLNGGHPKSILADFASREGSPTPLDNMKVLIPGNTGPTGNADVTAVYTHVDGYLNYNTQNLSYSEAGVANQREGFVRNELFSRHEEYDYNKSELYGHDITFGGFGDDPKGLKMYKEPHILRDMGQKWNGFSNEGTPFDEGAFRGGFLTLGNRALKDVVRNVKHIIEDPIKGLLWGLKQVGLQLSNPKVETELGPLFARPTRIFNLGIGLMANMLTGPFGIKLYRHGLLNGLGSDKGLYEAAVNAHNAADRFDIPGNYPGKGGGNRLIGLKEDLLLANNPFAGVGGLLGGLLGQTGEEIKSLSDSSFFFGPKSLYGIGGTTIRRYDNSHLHKFGKELDKHNLFNSGGDSSLLAKYATLSYGDLKEAADDTSNSFKDFRIAAYNGAPEGEDGFIGGALDLEDYESANREVLFGYKAYDHTRNRNDFQEDFGLTDWYNYEDFDADQDYTDEVDTIEGGRDMIKLIIEDIQTKKKVRFRSYVTDITDSITPSWSPTQYVGRPDNVYSYTNTERSVTFTLKLAAMSRAGMKGMYKKANFLYGLAYPHIRDTGSSSTSLQAPYIRLTVGDYLYKTPGFFDSLTVTIDQQSPWEINLENSPDVAQLPHMLTVALSFKVIGDGPHASAVQSDFVDDIRGTHIGGGLNNETAEGKFFENLYIKK
tara:strand:- start:3622 stop:7416 length:3795 start_codon:yes stop_codon:yes gene_type:complete